MFKEYREKKMRKMGIWDDGPRWVWTALEIELEKSEIIKMIERTIDSIEVDAGFLIYLEEKMKNSKENKANTSV